MTIPAIRVAVASSKGGTGKTSVTVAAASILARSGLRVLVIDMDPQSDAVFALGGDPTLPGAAEFLLGENPEPEDLGRGLFVLGGGPQLESVEVERLDPEALLDRLAGVDFDAIVIDTPPGSRFLRRFALVAASVALVPTSPHPFALRAATEITEEIEARRLKGRSVAARVGLVANAIDRRRGMDATFAANLGRIFGDRAAVFEVRQDSGLALATASRTPIAFSDEARASRRGLSDLEAVVAWVRETEGERAEGA